VRKRKKNKEEMIESDTKAHHKEVRGGEIPSSKEREKGKRRKKALHPETWRSQKVGRTQFHISTREKKIKNSPPKKRRKGETNGKRA